MFAAATVWHKQLNIKENFMLTGSRMNGCPRRTWSESSGWKSPSCQQKRRWSSMNSFARLTATRRHHHPWRNLLQPLNYQLGYYQPDTARLPACSTTCSPRKRQNVPTAALQTFRSSIKRMRTKLKSPVPGNARWDADTEGTHSGLADDKLLIWGRLELLLKLESNCARENSVNGETDVDSPNGCYVKDSQRRAQDC